MWNAIGLALKAMFWPKPGELAQNFIPRILGTALFFGGYLASTLLFLLIFGRLPFFHGFATIEAVRTEIAELRSDIKKASETQATIMAVTTGEVHAMTLGAIEDQIIKNRTKQCAALVAQPLNADTLSYANEGLRKKLGEWRAQAGYEYDRTPSCHELGY